MGKETESRTFETGTIVTTPGALRTVNAEDMWNCLCRHVSCDWGDCCPEDAQENEFSLDKFLRLFSVYHDRSGVKFWIITEADRLVTTILLPEDY